MREKERERERKRKSNYVLNDILYIIILTTFILDNLICYINYNSLIIINTYH
jgi:hypothetical protein